MYDLKKKELTSIVFVLTGSYKNGAVVTPTASVVEWQVEKPKDD